MDPLPSTPTSALATIRGDGLIVVRPEELDDATLRKLVVLSERLRRRRQRTLAFTLALPYGLVMLGGFHPLLALPGLVLGAIGTGVSVALIKGQRRGYVKDARDLGIAPEVARDVDERARKASSGIPRWVTGQARVRAIARRIRGIPDDDTTLAPDATDAPELAS